MAKLTVRNGDHNTRRPERGSALLLVPVMVLILILAAGLTVDSAIAFTAKRDLVEAASAAANDAATSISEDMAFQSGQLDMDMGSAEQRAKAAVSVRSNNLASGISVTDVSMVDRNGPAIQVTVAGTARFIFAKAIPGRSSTLSLTATATASLQESP